MKIDSRLHSRNGSRPKGLLSLPGRTVQEDMRCPGGIRLFCPPLPPMHAASPPCGHPAGTQRVQRLRQCSVAGGSSGDSFAALASVGSARAACPFPLAYTRRGMPHSGRFCRAPGIVGSVSRRCCGDRVFHRYAFFLCRSRKKREVLSIKHNNPIEGRRKRRLFPSINIIIFNTGTHASAPSGRHSCRREHSSLHPCPGLGHFLPASPGCVRCASTARCAACRPAKPRGARLTPRAGRDTSSVRLRRAALPHLSGANYIYIYIHPPHTFAIRNICVSLRL